VFLSITRFQYSLPFDGFLIGLFHSPPNKLTAVFWGFINTIPTLVLSIVVAFSRAFQNNVHDQSAMIAWLISMIVVFAIIFAINSSIHSYLVVKYAKADKIAVSVGLYYMSNSVGRLFGTLVSGVLYTFVGNYEGPYAGTNSTSGFAACFLAGTLSSILAAIITFWIDDQSQGLKCGPCLTIASKSLGNDGEEENMVELPGVD
jgi:ABC-type polysaccharide/polyol phosphate export permease